MNYDGYAVVLSDKKDIVESINGEAYVNPNLNKIYNEIDINYPIYNNIKYSKQTIPSVHNGYSERNINSKDYVLFQNIQSKEEASVLKSVGAIANVYYTYHKLYYEIPFDKIEILSSYHDITKLSKSFNSKTAIVKYSKRDNNDFEMPIHIATSIVGIITKNNMIYTDTSVIKILDFTQKVNNNKNFIPVSVNVTDKTSITIPDVNDMQNISIVIQKNNFFELELSSVPNNIIGLPSGITWIGNKIKGTFIDSKEYNLKITYNQGEQNINIIVPYYERLL